MVKVRVMGVNQYRVSGKLYQYWRRKGHEQIRIDPPLKGAALAAKVAELENRYLKPKAIAGTLRLLVREYQHKSNQFNGLGPRTKVDYDRVFKWLGDAMDYALVTFTAPEIAKLRDKAAREHDVKFGNQVVTTLKRVFAYGIESGAMRDNPAKDIAKLTGGNKRPNRALSPKEAVTLLDGANPCLKAAIGLALFTGLRLGDIIAVRRNAISDGYLEHVQHKTSKIVRAYVPDDLRYLLDGLPENTATTLLVKANGTPWTYEGFKTAFQRHRDALEASGAIGEGVTFHGLRASVATILAEAGFDEWQVGILLGHASKTVTGRSYISAEYRNLLTDMALTLEETYRTARGNVVRLERR